MFKNSPIPEIKNPQISELSPPQKKNLSSKIPPITGFVLKSHQSPSWKSTLWKTPPSTNPIQRLPPAFVWNLLCNVTLWYSCDSNCQDTFPFRAISFHLYKEILSLQNMCTRKIVPLRAVTLPIGETFTLKSVTHSQVFLMALIHQAIRNLFPS